MRFLLVLVVATLAGCVAGERELDLPRDHVARIVEVAPRGTYELDLRMEKGANLTFAYDATFQVQWDVHSHATDGSVHTWKEGRGTRGEGRFDAPETGTYSLIFTNPSGAEVTLDLLVDGRFEVVPPRTA